MAVKGSNDLNLLLKAKVVKIKVELDYKSSNLPSQVNKITAFLKDKPVKLKVKLDASVKDIQKQIREISSTMEKSKTFKPMRITVEMDVKGSAEKIKKQLKEVHDLVADFNKKYGKQLKDMQEMQIKAQQIAQASKSTKGANIKNDATVQGWNNIKNYITQMEQAEKQLRGKFSDGKGLFSTTQFKDAQGNLHAFVASLERANGVVERIKYQWNADKNQFQVIDRQTMTQTDKMIHKSMQSLVDLQRELDKTGKASSQLTKEYKQLEQAGANKTLTMDMVKAFQTKVKNAQQEVQVQKQLNDLKREEAKLLRDIKNVTKGVKNGNTAFKSEMQDLMSKTRKAQNMDAMKDIRVELGRLSDKVTAYNAKQKETSQVEKQRESALRQLTKYLRETHEVHGALAQDNIRAVQQLAQRAKTTKQMADVQKHLNSMYKAQTANKDLESRQQALQKLQKIMVDYAKTSGRSLDSTNAYFENKKKNISGNLAQIHAEIAKWNKKLHDETIKREQDILRLQQGNSKKLGNTGADGKLKTAITNKDVAGVKEYIAQMLKADIATAKLATNDKGVTKITATLASTGKTAKQVTYEVDRMNKSLRLVGEQEVFNRNANLGVFEQMRIALQRVPVWMASMTVFYGSINAFKSMGQEILTVDKALTELKRVASDSINIDTIFQGAVGLSKELGNNIHDIMQAVNDLARTYGDFNERQLLAVAKTAVLMSNVSDLSAQEATDTLVGTMNAFNIVAEDSIRIVDSLNEVDNDYAISTKQLATGLQKSASTARTFGVELEENVGHITAIGAVTMESGNIIGNSLKTIYSRITTIDEARGILDSVGVSLYSIGENGQKAIKPVNDILSDLAGRWKGLSDEQRQNIAVTVAGRYQLSRFLALMNNWSMSTKATRTALSAQGSAMRENAKYMESFEARINKLKNSFTEISLAFGEAFMGGTMLLFIEGLAELANVITKVTKVMGGLPLILGAVGAVIGVITFKTGSLAKSAGTAGAFLGNMRLGFTQASVGANIFSTSLNRVMGAMGTFSLLAPAVNRGLLAMRGALLGIASMTGIGLLFVGLGIAMEKLIGYFEKQKKIAEKAEKANKQLIDSYRNTEGGLDNLIAKQEELQRKVDTGAIKEGTDAYNEYVKVTNTLAEKMPTVVKYIDQSGLAHLNTSKAIKEQYDIAKKLSDLKHDETKMKFEEKLAKETNKYQEQKKAVKELKKELKDLQDSDGKTKKYWDSDSKSYIEITADNFDEIQKKNIEIIEAEKSKAEHMQKVMILVQDTTMAYLESDKQLKNLTDAGKTVIENMVQSNEELLRYSEKGGKMVENNQETVEKNANKLLDLGKQLGEFMSNTYEQQTKGVTDPMQLQEIKTNIDNLIKALPDTFFKLESLNNVDDLKTRFQGVLSVADQVKNKKGNFDSLTKSLIEQGFSADEAKGYVANLAMEYNNAEIRSQAMTQAQNEGQESLENWVDTAIKAIDLSEQLFNVGDEDVNAMKSHIQNLQQLTTMYGKNAKNTESYQASMEALSLYTGLPDNVIAKDLNYYKNMLDLMGKVELQYDENTGALIGFNKEGLNKQQIDRLNEMIHLGREHGATIDLVTGKIYDLKTGVELVYDKNGTPIKKIGDDAKEASKSLEETKKKVSDLKQQTIFNTGDTSADTTKQKADNVKKSLNDVKMTAYELKQQQIFNEADASPANTKKKVDDVKSSLDKVKTTFNEVKQGQIFNQGDTSPTTTKTKIDEVSKSLETVKGKFHDMKQAKLFEEESVGTGVKSKVDELTEAIKKATSGTKLLNDLNTMIGDSTNKVTGLLEKLNNLATGMSNIGNKASEISAVHQAIVAMSSAMVAVQTNIGSMFNGMASSMSKVTVVAEATKLKVIGLGQALAGLGGLTTGGLSAWSSSINQLSAILYTSSQYASAYVQSLSGVGSAYGQLASIIGVAINAIINYFGGYVQALQAMTILTAKGLSGIINSFTISSKIVGSRISAMAESMRTEMRKGVNGVVAIASGMPQRIADAIRSNMYHVVSAMARLSQTVSNTTLRPSIKMGNRSVGAYAKGGIVNKMELAWHGEEGAEAIIPLIPKRRKRGLELWKEAGNRLGIPSELIDYMKARASRGKGGVARSGGTFGTSSGEGGEGGGGDSGTSGILQPSKYEGGTTLSGGYAFSTSELAEKVIVNPYERQNTILSGNIGQLEARLQGVIKNTIKYRDLVSQIAKLERSRLQIVGKDLRATEARNKKVKSMLDALSKVKKHTESQRETYNKLQQEYDSNLSKIASLRTEIENIKVGLQQKSIELFDSLVDETLEQFNKAIDKLSKSIDNIDFKMDVLELTSPDDVKGQLGLFAQKIQELKIQQQQIESLKRELTDKYNIAVKKYGKNSVQAKRVLDELDALEEQWEDVRLAVLQTEKEMNDVRANIADQAIDALKNYYSQMKSMAVEAIDLEREHLQKLHDDKMEMYDDEIKRINDIYDEKLKAIDDEASEQDHQSVLAEKNAQKSELVNKISLLSRDNSLEGKKKLAEAQAELVALEKEIAEYMSNYQREQLKKDLEAQKAQQIEAIESQKEVEQTKFDETLSRLDEEKKAIEKHYDDILNNERYWANMRAEFMKGNFTALQTELKGMYANLENMNKGMFDGLSAGFKNFSSEVKAMIAEINKLVVDNLIFDSEGLGKKVGDAGSIPKAPASGTLDRGRITTGVFGKRASADAIRSVLEGSYGASASVIESDGGFRVLGDFSSYERAEKVLADMKKKNTISVGYVSRFDTGGYTGDWSGSDGKLAILDKKELVLNERQTSDILNTAKLMDKIKTVLPNVSRNDFATKLANAGGINISNTYKLTVNIDNLNGNKDGAKTVVKEIMKGFKKIGG